MSGKPEECTSRFGTWLLLVAALGLVIGPSALRAQEATVQGILREEGTAQPLRNVEVVLERNGDTIRTAVSDRNGLFQISGLPAGVYRLRLTLFGYASHEETVRLDPGQVRTVNRELALDPVQLEGMSVAGLGPGAVRRELGVQTIMVEQLAYIPTPAASGDLVSFLQTQPGVVGSGDRGGQLFIRGGTPSENLVLMDGMLIYQPFHITGIFSVFPEDLIQSAEFHAGGYGPQYTSRTSSVLDVQMRDGNRTAGSASASISPFLASAMAEGPLGDDRNSYLLSFRRSMIRETSPWLLGQEQPVGFDSEYLRLTHFSEDGSARCSLTALRSRDEGGLDPDDPVSRVGWTNLLVGGRCMMIAGQTFMDVRFGRTAVQSEAVTRGASEFSSSASRIFIAGDASHIVAGARVNWGADVRMIHTGYDLQELLTENESQRDQWPVAGIYGELDVPVGAGLRVLPGTAVSVARGDRPAFEPRLRASWDVPGVDGELNGALGIYEQRLSGISDRRDASSIFAAWVRTPEGRRQSSVHAQTSWTHSPGGGFSYSIDAYYRRMENRTVAVWTPVAQFAPELTLTRGRGHGGDARVELRRGPLYLFGAYAYGRTRYDAVDRDFGIWFGERVDSYHPAHDRRHQVSALASLEVSETTLAARWEYGSGFPFTRTIGFDELLDFRTEDRRLPRPPETFGDTRVLLERPYDGRLPPTHRLDVSVQRLLELGTAELDLQAGVINTYNQTNIFYYDLFADRRIDQLPFAPYVSAELQLPTHSRP